MKEKLIMTLRFLVPLGETSFFINVIYPPLKDKQLTIKTLATCCQKKPDKRLCPLLIIAIMENTAKAFRIIRSQIREDSMGRLRRNEKFAFFGIHR